MNETSFQSTYLPITLFFLYYEILLIWLTSLIVTVQNINVFNQDSNAHRALVHGMNLTCSEYKRIYGLIWIN